MNMKVYILERVDDYKIDGVFASKEAAFNAILADSILQDGVTPTAEMVILGCDIYAHYNESLTKLFGLTTPAEDRVYLINDYDVK